MVAMTPIKEILVVDQTVFYVDHVGHLNFAANTGSRSEALVVASSLANHHRLQDSIYALDVEDHEVIKVAWDMASRGRRK